MSLKIHNSRELINPENYRAKVLVISQPGGGKTTWAATAPNPGFAACEQGLGKGLLSIANMGVDFVEPENERELDSICSGQIFKDKDTLVIDSGSEMCRTFIKDAALAIPRRQGASEKRSKGVPELDDYGVMAEIFRRLMQKLINQPKHIIVTAGMRIQTPNLETGIGQFLIGPDLPGQLFLGAPAMFDLVLQLRTRQVNKVKGDAKTRYSQRYFITQPDNTHIAKCRANKLGNVPLLDVEEIFDYEAGLGTFPFLLNKILTGYREIYEAKKTEAVPAR